MRRSKRSSTQRSSSVSRSTTHRSATAGRPARPERTSNRASRDGEDSRRESARAGSTHTGERRSGRIEGHADGHGFFVPDDGSAWIFLPADEMAEAMQGDRAIVRVVGMDPRGRPAGRIVELQPKADRRIVGRL
jgi:ribonuclease R